MRQVLIDTLLGLAEEDESIFLITADLGWSVVEPFARAFPDRFLNVGVAEANMVGVATGLTQVGCRPFLYTIASFALRCYEQLRNGPVHHGLPVRFVGIGGGFAYGHAGPTHFALEDLVVMRTLPGMTTLIPADGAHTRSVVRAAAALPGPAYLRIAKDDPGEIPGLGGRFARGRPEVVREGRDLLFLCCGTVTHVALRAAAGLGEEGHAVAVAVMGHLPFGPSPELIELLARYPRAITVEEGFTAGGLGSLCAEAIATGGLGCRLTMLGVQDQPSAITGGGGYHRAKAGLDEHGLSGAARRALKERG